MRRAFAATAVIALAALAVPGADAGPGLGACAYGIGISQPITGVGPDVYVGVVVGPSPPIGFYYNRNQFERECCRSGGDPPNCFGYRRDGEA